MYKTILVHLDADDPSSEARVRYAAALARDYHATLIGAAARMPLPAVEVYAAGAPLLAGGVTTSDPKELSADFAHAHSRFKTWTSGMHIETDWRSAVDFPSSALATMANAADLIVVGAPGSSHPDGFRFLDCGDLMMIAGRPILAVPDDTTTVNLSGAVVAWKNTREARRALADALPLLAQAEIVTLLHISEGESDDISLADAKSFLERHGIASKIARSTRNGSTVGDVIVDTAKRTQSGLIVAGAYGHTRVREWAFGGVTRQLLKGCPVPVLFGR